MALGFSVGICNILVHNMHTYIRARRKHPKNDIFFSLSPGHVPCIYILYFSVFSTVVRERRLYIIIHHTLCTLAELRLGGIGEIINRIPAAAM